MIIMKKKLITLTLMVAITVSAAGCGAKTEPQPEVQETETAESTEAVTEEKAEEQTTEPADTSGQTDVNTPDDDNSIELDEYSNDAIDGYAEEAAPSIDISGCDTFTQIVDKKLTEGMGYANVSLLNTDVLLVSSGTFDDMEFGINAIDAAVFEYDKDGVPCEIGKICSGGTAYPISVKDGYLYTGSNHWICKWAAADGKISIMEKAAVVYDTDGNGTYYYESDDGGDYSSMDSAEAEQIFDDLIAEMMDGEPVVFDTITK